MKLTSKHSEKNKISHLLFPINGNFKKFSAQTIYPAESFDDIESSMVQSVHDHGDWLILTGPTPSRQSTGDTGPEEDTSSDGKKGRSRFLAPSFPSSCSSFAFLFTPLHVLLSQNHFRSVSLFSLLHMNNYFHN